MAGISSASCRICTNSDDLRVLDENGERAFHLFRFKELAEPVMFEPDEGSRAKISVDDLR